MEQLLKTGTTTVGLVCKDGIVLAADRKVTAGNYIMARDFEKVIVINENIAVTTAGLVSDVQLLTKVIRAQIKLDELRRARSIKIREAANMLANLVYSNIRKMSMVQGVTGFLIGGRDKQGYSLYALGVDGSLTEYKNFCADGSGMMFALGVFESEYKNGISVSEGVALVEKAITASIRRDTASGAGLDVVTITKDGTKRVVSKNLSEKLE